MQRLEQERRGSSAQESHREDNGQNDAFSHISLHLLYESFIAERLISRGVGGRSRNWLDCVTRAEGACAIRQQINVRV